MQMQAKLYVGAVIAAAAGVVALSLPLWHAGDPRVFALYLLLTAVAATVKIQLPGVTGTISLSFLFLVFAAAEMQLAEAAVTAFTAALVQCLWRPHAKPKLVQIAFSAAALVVSVAIAQMLARFAEQLLHTRALLPQLVAGAFGFYLTNTLLIAIVLCLAESRPLGTVWNQCHLWAFPYYLTGAILLDLISVVDVQASWRIPFIVLPMMVLATGCYRAYANRAIQLGNTATTR